MRIKKEMTRINELLGKAIVIIKGKPISEDSNLITFRPLIALTAVFVLLEIYYFFAICYPIESTNIKAAYTALKEHKFIYEIGGVYLALVAFFTAWHRSLVTSFQSSLQVSTKNITNYFSMSKYISDNIDRFSEESQDPFSFKIKPKDGFGPIIQYLFQAPENGLFTLNQALHRDVKIFIQSAEKVINESNFKEDTNAFKKNYSDLTDNEKSILKENRKFLETFEIYDLKETHESRERIDEILSRCNLIDNIPRNKISKLHFEIIESETDGIFKVFKAACIYSHFLVTLSLIANSLPISKHEKEPIISTLNYLKEFLEEIRIPLDIRTEEIRRITKDNVDTDLVTIKRLIAFAYESKEYIPIIDESALMRISKAKNINQMINYDDCEKLIHILAMGICKKSNNTRIDITQFHTFNPEKPNCIFDIWKRCYQKNEATDAPVNQL
ncbi:hypothetical protein [Thalassolituus pacificus]|uniref:Uncharacterized protein n=1 Tax=Thalassolituus pacificus TaxID=2975440 RepID=A0A9X3ARA3_9GAMM|nr:hypothetical protein [Thalassolituus pacificus]MCT7357558.1 hypothetical protein [Thalassolituus pacificus]